MDGKELRELIDLISKSNFVTFELEREGFRLKLEKGGGAGSGRSAGGERAGPVIASPPAVAAPAAVPAAQEPSPRRPCAPSPAVDAAPSGLVDMTLADRRHLLPAAEPGRAPVRRAREPVKKGQVLCIIEAMKLMNEIEAEMDAEVVEILVANGQPVEFGEVLFRLRPMAS